MEYTYLQQAAVAAGQFDGSVGNIPTGKFHHSVNMFFIFQTLERQ